MKKLIFPLAVAILFGAASCAKCTTCTKSNATDVRFCEKDYSSNTAYGAQRDLYESQGYDCTKTP